MEIIPLNPVPNQKVSFNVDGAFWQLKLYGSIVNMCADISLNGTLLISGVRCFVGTPLLPYGYLQSPSFGNFIFNSDVDWRGFGDVCQLYYLEQSEFASFEQMMLSGQAATS
jgi:hypothetical protein